MLHAAFADLCRREGLAGERPPASGAVAEASLEFRQLKYFMQVLEAKSFTRAARDLGLAQPALSYQILKLEDELGQKLLVRHSRGVEPTEAGQRVSVAASSILDLVRTIHFDLQEMSCEPKGQLHLGLPRGLSELLAVDALQACRARYPNVNLTIAEHLSFHLTELLAADRLDMIFTYSADQPDRIRYEPILRERLCLVQSPSEPCKSGEDVTFAEVARCSLILPGLPHVGRKLLNQAAKDLQLELHVIYEVDSVSLMIDMVERGVGATVQPYMTVRRAAETGRVRVRAIKQPEITRRLYIGYPRKRELSQSHLLVRDFLIARLLNTIDERTFDSLVWRDLSPALEELALEPET
jgi:LysR family nitrogen assimilation transcriptional regulator